MMKHLQKGRLRAFSDGALSPDERVAVQAHLDACAHCSRRAEQLAKRAASVGELMSTLSPHVEGALSPQVARQRFDGYVDRQKMEDTMSSKLFSRRARPVWAAVTLVVLLAVSLTLPPVRTLASNFLALFRVQEIKVVEFNPLNLPDEQAMEDAFSAVEGLVMEEVTFEEYGEPRIVDEATARTAVDFGVRFPTGLEPVHQVDIQPGMSISMVIDLPRLRTLLSELGYGSVRLPDSLDGMAVGVDIAPSVTASYGACAAETMDDCTLLVQMPSPSVNAPPDLDVDQLGLLYLQVLGMSKREAERFSQNVDWTTTLVVPIPSSHARYQNVNVDGVTGTFIQAQSPNSPEYALLWVKNDVVYGLVGSGSRASALEIVRSLE